MSLDDLRRAVENKRRVSPKPFTDPLYPGRTEEIRATEPNLLQRFSDMGQTLMDRSAQLRSQPIELIKQMANRAINGVGMPVTTGLEPGPVERFIGESTRRGAEMQQEFLSSKVPEFLARHSAPGPIQEVAKFGGAVAGTAGEILAQQFDEGNPAFSQAAMGFHGSAHLFDKFNIKKIGTGEGAQAYGHGLYFAENPKVAKEYMLAGNRQNIEYFPLVEYKGVDVARQNLTPTQKAAINLIATDGHELAIKYATNSGRKELAEEIAKIPKKDVVNKMIERVPSNVKGNMYKVDIPDEKVAGMLDWDKPLSEQPEILKRTKDVIIKKFPENGLDMGGGKVLDNRNYQVSKKPYPYILKSGESEFGISQKDVDRMLGGDKGEALYTRLTASLGSQEKASQYLQSKGIPGIKYLDQGSRGRTAWEVVAPQGGINEFPNEAQARAFLKNNPEGKLKAPKQTRNIVAFDDKIVNILEVNGKKVGKPGLEDLSSRWESKGVKNQLTLDNQGNIQLNKIIVPKGSRGQGVGSKFMKELTEFADANGHRITASPSTDFGATSAGRVGKFNKKFGFVDNKGRNKDFTISDTMFREPKKK